MRIQHETILVAAVALCVGAALGWFAARYVKNESEEVLARPSLGEGSGKHGNMEAANGGRARSPITPNEKVKPRRKAESRRTAEVRAEKFNEPQTEPVVKPTEMPVQEEVAEQQKKDEDPFPRYLDMFKNNPETLAAEFEKEAEADRANQRNMRDKAIAKLKLNAEQAAFFEKALDDIRSAVLQQEQELVGLIASGQLNMDTATDGRLWDSNLLLMDQSVATREKIVRDAAVELYNRLDIDSVPDAEKQRVIQWATIKTSFSCDCYEPALQVYDKVYKNFGFGNGIFSWCIRQSQKK